MTSQVLRSNHYRDEALRRLQAGQEYAFLASALPYLERYPDDWHLRLLAARTYLGLSLIPPARDVLDEGADIAGAPGELERVRQSLRHLDRPPIPWASLASIFERNLAALPSTVNASELRDAWQLRQDEYQLYKDRHDQYQLRERTSDNHWRWLPLIGDHARDDAERPLPDGMELPMPAPCLFEGVGLGRYFERVYAATTNTFLSFSCALFVVEPEPARLAAALHLNDWTRLLADPRVHLSIGPAWAARLRDAWEGDWDLPIPRQVISIGPRPTGDLRAIDVLQEVATAREQAIAQSIDDLNQRYGNRTREYWARRFTDALAGLGQPLRILAGVSIHTTFLQHSMRDFKRAVESLGHRCEVVSERSNHAVVGPLTYHQAIRQLDPDLFFCIDHLRPEFGTLLPRNLPLLTWDQDALPHVLTRENLAGMGPEDFLVTCLKLRCLELGTAPAQCIAARVPTCPEQFDGPPLTRAEQAKYACDVSYVSHASQTPREFHLDERARYAQPQLQELLDTIYEVLPAHLERSIVATEHVTEVVLDEALARCGLRIPDEGLRGRLTGWYIWRLADRIFRHQALEWVALWAQARNATLRVYGNGWEKHPTLSAFAAGPAQNGRELLCIYRASKINLQLMPAGFIHQRSLDGLASGGFFLARLAPHDLKGALLRRLVRTMERLGVSSTAAMHACDDPQLHALLAEYLGRRLDRTCGRDVYNQVRVNAELEHPDEVFSDFRDVCFDAAGSFATLADQFIGDGPARQAVTQRMRSVVVEKFAYKSAVQRFLSEMAAWLAKSGQRTRAPVFVT